MPWHLSTARSRSTIFLGSLGAVLGPLYGIMVADYYLVKREQLAVDDLYRADASSSLWYTNGFNPVAIKAFVPAAASRSRSP